jgi:hypothetical protein
MRIHEEKSIKRVQKFEHLGKIFQESFESCKLSHDAKITPMLGVNQTPMKATVLSE